MAHSQTADVTRRDFLFVATGAFGAVGVAATVLPIVDQMNPSADVLALASIEVDLSPIQPGQSVTFTWRSHPLFVRRRTPQEIEAARAVNVDDLIDPLARNANLPDSAPASDDNRAAKDKEPWLVMIGICTHLGCIPKGQAVGDYKGEYGGWFCPCHGSQYDTAGRVRIGPAPENLSIPPYSFTSDTKLKIG